MWGWTEEARTRSDMETIEQHGDAWPIIDIFERDQDLFKKREVSTRRTD
jgi:hypothetical protein